MKPSHATRTGGGRGGVRCFHSSRQRAPLTRQELGARTAYKAKGKSESRGSISMCGTRMHVEIPNMRLCDLLRSRPQGIGKSATQSAHPTRRRPPSQDAIISREKLDRSPESRGCKEDSELNARANAYLSTNPRARAGATSHDASLSTQRERSRTGPPKRWPLERRRRRNHGSVNLGAVLGDVAR